MQETVLETKRIELLIPHPKQREFVNSKAKFRAYIGGVGSGKTYIGCAEMVMHALSNPKSLNMIIAPTYRLMKDVTERAFYKICPEELIKEVQKANQSCVLVNGSEILFRNADDADLKRGPTLSSFFIDEGSKVAADVWPVMIGRLRQEGFARRGWVVSTPKGFNWIHKEFVQKQRPDYQMVKSTIYENPYLPADYVQSLEEAWSGRFARQELLGEFEAPEGLVYRNFYREKHVVKLNDRKFKDIIFGVDWGWQHENVLLAIGIDSDHKFYILDEFCRSHVLMEDFVKIALEFQAKYGAGTFYADPSQPEHIRVFNNAGLNCVEANNEILAGINIVSTALDVKKEDNLPRLFIDPKCVNTITEFEMYSYAEQVPDKPQQDKPLKIYDNCMDALRYALASLGVGELRLLPSDKGAFF
mgnify:FL=1